MQKSSNSWNCPGLMQCFTVMALAIYVQRSCQSPPTQGQLPQSRHVCFKCGQRGHIQKQCRCQENGEGLSSLGPRHLATIHRPINKKLPITDNVKVPIDFQENIFFHDFLVVNKLITPVILGIDFLQKHKPTLILVTVLL